MHIGIRSKLLLVSLSLIAIPVAGYRFIQEMETFLRQAQDQNLSTTVQALTLLAQNSPEFTNAKTAYPALYVHPFHPVILDGYDDDWQNLLPLAQSFSPVNGIPYKLLLSNSPRYLYLLLKVERHLPRYVQAANIDYGQSDQVLLKLSDSRGQERNYIFAPRAPGSIIARVLVDDHVGNVDFRLQGEWQEAGGGYNLEIRLPRQLAETGLSIQALMPQQSDTLPLLTNMKPLPLIRPSAELHKIMENFHLPNARLWITDKQGWVLAKTGALQENDLPDNSNMPWLLRKLLNLFLQHHGGETAPIAGNSIHIDSDLLLYALNGKTSTRRYHQPDSETLVISTAHPIIVNDSVQGAVILEQTTGAILSLQNQAMQRLLTITFTLFVIVALALLGFASLLTSRIRRLHQQMELAVAPDGRIIGQITSKESGDEIEELKQGFSNVLTRLQEYNRYLQAMASRLSHEFRTPLTIIRTSLESSEQVDSTEDKHAYLQRALNGVDRLELILRQLQEATRLEKALEQAETTQLDLCELLAFSLDSYVSIHPEIKFQLQPCTNCKVKASPELIHQALEKLLDNAVDFHHPGTTISLELRIVDTQAFICVSNHGSLASDNLDLFQSMISLRKQQQDQPHLGLGLYLVKLIAEFHQGQTSVSNDEENQTVQFCFSVSIHS